MKRILKGYCVTLPLQDSQYSTGRTKSNYIKSNHIKKEQKPEIY